MQKADKNITLLVCYCHIDLYCKRLTVTQQDVLHSLRAEGRKFLLSVDGSDAVLDHIASAFVASIAHGLMIYRDCDYEIVGSVHYINCNQNNSRYSRRIKIANWGAVGEPATASSFCCFSPAAVLDGESAAAIKSMAMDSRERNNSRAVCSFLKAVIFYEVM